MATIQSSLPYDITQATSIFEYSKGLLGKTLREFVWEGYKPKKGKGSLGQMVENIYFLLETNNYAGADFSEAGMELKCTPLKKSKQDDYLIKEHLVCNMINYCEVVNEDFWHSFQLTHRNATNVLQNHIGILLLCTTHNYSSQLSHHRDSSLSHISTNEWNGEYLLNSECTLVHCPGHALNPQASAPS